MKIRSFSNRAFQNSRLEDSLQSSKHQRVRAFSSPSKVGVGWEEQKRQVCLIHSPNDDIKLSSADRLSSSAEPNINRAFTIKKRTVQASRQKRNILSSAYVVRKHSQTSRYRPDKIFKRYTTKRVRKSIAKDMNRY